MPRPTEAGSLTSARRASDGGGRRSRWSWAVLPVITLVGFALRFATIDSKGFWLDECITVAQANQSFAQVYSDQIGNVHPPLFHLLTRAWMGLFGVGEIAVRSFAVAVGVATIPLAYWAGRNFYDRRTGRIAAVLLAFSPFAIWYSQEARMYALLMFFGFLGLAVLLVAMRTNKARWWVGYGLTTFAGLFTHYFYAFVLLGEIVGFVVLGAMRRRRLKLTGRSDTSRFAPRRLFRDVPSLLPWFASMLVTGAVFALWASRSVFDPAAGNTLVSSATGSGLGYGQAAPALAWRLNDFGMVIAQMAIGFHSEKAMFSFVALWPLVISVMLVLLGSVGKLARASVLALCASSGVIMIGILGQWQGQVLASRYFAAVAAPMILVAAAAIALLPRRTGRIVLAIIMALSLVAYVDQSFNHDNQMRYDNREAIQIIVDGYRPGDVVVFEPYYLNWVFTYYLPEGIPSHAFPYHAQDGSLRNGKDKLGQDLARAVGPAPRVWLYLSYLDIEAVRGDAYNTRNWFLRNGYTRAWQRDLARVELSLFEATPTRTVPPHAGGDW